MRLTRYQTSAGPRWAADGQWLSAQFQLDWITGVDADKVSALVTSCITGGAAEGDLLAPVEAQMEIWASGVTYLRSREARMHESDTADIYDKVYAAERPELFFKCAGWRAKGPGQPIRVRRDASWNVPEPELVLVSNAAGQIIGYTAGNDVSSRDIEGENPLYLPQAKMYNGSCGLGPAIELCDAASMSAIPIRLRVTRGGEVVFDGETGIDQMKRSLQELVDCLHSELDMPLGSLLLTGAGLVPGDDFTLTPGDDVRIDVGPLTLNNPVGQ
jgi:2-dehydro-3-deoxy-D-arabinonate dehydratase